MSGSPGILWEALGTTSMSIVKATGRLGRSEPSKKN